jgi:hypothetical protein
MNRGFFVAISLTSSLAYADRRSFTYTYEYATAPKGQTEVEVWHTQSRDTWKSSSPQRFEQILEIEHGITDRWDAAMYTVFKQVASPDAAQARSFGLDAVKLESRYRFAERGEWPVDTVAYFEVAKDFGKGVYELEAKAIAARDFDRLTVAANLIGEVEVGRDVAETELELGFAAGATYELSPALRLGAETWGGYGEGETRVAIGPALSLAPSSRFWFALTTGFGVTEISDKLTGRLIMGFAL